MPPVTWRNVATANTAGALALASRSGQNIGAGIAGVGDAFSKYGQQKIKRTTDENVAALLAAAPEDRASLMQGFADSGLSMDTDRLGETMKGLKAEERLGRNQKMSELEMALKEKRAIDEQNAQFGAQQTELHPAIQNILSASGGAMPAEAAPAPTAQTDPIASSVERGDKAVFSDAYNAVSAGKDKLGLGKRVVGDYVASFAGEFEGLGVRESAEKVKQIVRDHPGASGQMLQTELMKMANIDSLKPKDIKAGARQESVDLMNIAINDAIAQGPITTSTVAEIAKLGRKNSPSIGSEDISKVLETPAANAAMNELETPEVDGIVSEMTRQLTDLSEIAYDEMTREDLEALDVRFDSTVKQTEAKLKGINDMYKSLGLKGSAMSEAKKVLEGTNYPKLVDSVGALKQLKSDVRKGFVEDVKTLQKDINKDLADYNDRVDLEKHLNIGDKDFAPVLTAEINRARGIIDEDTTFSTMSLNKKDKLARWLVSRTHLPLSKEEAKGTWFGEELKRVGGVGDAELVDMMKSKLSGMRYRYTKAGLAAPPVAGDAAKGDVTVPVETGAEVKPDTDAIKKASDDLVAKRQAKIKAIEAKYPQAFVNGKFSPGLLSPEDRKEYRIANPKKPKLSFLTQEAWDKMPDEQRALYYK